MDINNRLDITSVFCDVDDFCQTFEWHYQNAQLLSGSEQPLYYSSHIRVVNCPVPKSFTHKGSGTQDFTNRLWPLYRSRLRLSEVMTIVIAFHGSGFRTFKDFYCFGVLPHWRKAFPNLVSYNRFVEQTP